MTNRTLVRRVHPAFRLAALTLTVVLVLGGSAMVIGSWLDIAFLHPQLRDVLVMLAGIVALAGGLGTGLIAANGHFPPTIYGFVEDNAEQGQIKKRLGKAFALGGSAWLMAVVSCYVVNSPGVSMVLLPLWLPIGLLAGQGPPLGPPEQHHYEGTVVHLIAALAGVGLSGFIYVAMVYAWLRWRHHRSSPNQDRAAPR